MSEMNGHRPVLVTTAHRGVFFGYAAKTDGDQIELKKARLCVYWSRDMKGFMGLAANGPSDEDGRPANGGRCAAVAVGTVHREKGPLRSECGRGQLHATLVPTKWQGQRWWIVALIGERRGDDEKYWALEREVIGECV